MAQAREMEKRPGVLSVSLMAGFPYADVPDMGPSVIAVADGDREQAEAVADELGDGDVGRPRAAERPLPRAARGRAHGRIASTRTPVLLVDLGDNIGGGSAGDGTVLLAELLQQTGDGVRRGAATPRRRSQLAKAVGVGGTFEATGRRRGATGCTANRCASAAWCRSLHDGKWVETEARHGGRRENDQGPHRGARPRRRQHCSC